MHELKFGDVIPSWIPVPQKYVVFVDSNFHHNDMIGTIGLATCVGFGLWYGKGRGVICHIDSDSVPGQDEDYNLTKIFHNILNLGRTKGWGIPHSAIIATNTAGSIRNDKVIFNDRGEIISGHTKWTVDTLWGLCVKEGISPVMIRTTQTNSLYLNLMTGHFFQCNTYPGPDADSVAAILAETNQPGIDYRRLNFR